MSISYKSDREPLPWEDKPIKKPVVNKPEVVETLRAEIAVSEKPAAKMRVTKSGKRKVSLWLDDQVIEHFKKGGYGWQTRLNDALREYLGR